MGVSRKRSFQCTDNKIIDLADVLFGIEPEKVDEFLHRVLSRARTGTMQDIVATIQAAQYDVIRAPFDQVTVIEGGPGTGKTAIALHRVSWMLAREGMRLRAGDLLIVGPSPTFTRYIRDVLPSLGDSDVPIRDIDQLTPDVPNKGRQERTHVAALKGDARMAVVLARSLEARVGAPQPVERLRWDGRFVSIPGADITVLIDECRTLSLPYHDRRTHFSTRLAELVAQRNGRPVGASALANLLDRLWPPQSPAAFLRELLGSRRRLAAAADGTLTSEEVSLLYRQGAARVNDEVWSTSDLYLLDELHHLVTGDTATYRHIVVDEAQDLSPMQLRSVARRSATGSITVAGDIAQSTGLWARDEWGDLTQHLPAKLPVVIENLRYGYRVPRPAYELAAQLLPAAAPTIRPPELVRDGPAPTVHQVGLHERGDRVVAAAMVHTRAGRFVGIVCPGRCRREVETALEKASVAWSPAEPLGFGTVNLLSPAEAKGLEFDAVVVVEPELIVAETSRGLRMLYVALTRTTGYLDVVAAGNPLPLASAASHGADGPREPSVDRDQRNHDLAAHVIGQIRAAAAPKDWPDVLAEIARQLEP